MSSYNWRNVPLFLWVVILFALAIPLVVSSSSSDSYVKQPSSAAAKSRLNVSPSPSPSPPSYVEEIIKPTPTPTPPPTPPNTPGVSPQNCRYILGNSESPYSDCSGCRGTYLDSEGDMPVCMAP